MRWALWLHTQGRSPRIQRWEKAGLRGREGSTARPSGRCGGWTDAGPGEVSGGGQTQGPGRWGVDRGRARGGGGCKGTALGELGPLSSRGSRSDLSP